MPPVTLVRRWLHVLLVVSLVNLDTRASGDDLVIRTKKGRVRGKRYYLPKLDGRAVDAFLGIPFAKPPLSHLRFRPPVPNDRWKGTYNATKLPKSCYQLPDLFFGDFYGATMWNANTDVSEDCLYLNVWVPRTRPKLRKSAVLVWIFGGGFYYGTSTLDLYDGKILAAQNNIIVVSMNYRVGPFGFLSLGTPDAPGNAGMFDQLMALEWVQDNIRAFGGDPKNVTIFGESAGAVSVSLHLLSPLSRNKFNRAILQSGTANMPWSTYTRKEAIRRARDLAEAAGCKEFEDMSILAGCLRSLSPELIVHNQWVARGIMQFPFLPMTDGVFLIESPEMSLRRGNFKKCDILLGSNKNEGNFFIIYEIDSLNRTHTFMDKETFQKSMQQLFFWYPQWPQQINSIGRDAIVFQYSTWLDPNNKDRNLENLDNAVGDSQFVCHLNKFANHYAKARQNVYHYYFTERFKSNRWPEWMGVLHGDEIMFVFGDPLKKLEYTFKEQQLSKKMMAYWTNFAKTGDPNREPGKFGLNEWPPHTPDGKEYLELNSKFLHDPDKSRAIGRGPRAQECAFWQDYLPRLVEATEDITEAEKEWKLQFHEWSTKYIVDWKNQYDSFIKLQNTPREQRCPGD